jgi:hypothetical protein
MTILTQKLPFQKIAWEDILYLESMQNYIKLHFKDDVSVIHQTMTVLEQTLPQNIFFRIHKSFLVNINHIDSISGGRLFINKQELPIAGDRKSRLLESIVYSRFVFRQLSHNLATKLLPDRRQPIKSLFFPVVSFGE